MLSTRANDQGGVAGQGLRRGRVALGRIVPPGRTRNRPGASREAWAALARLRPASGADDRARDRIDAATCILPLDDHALTNFRGITLTSVPDRRYLSFFCLMHILRGTLTPGRDLAASYAIGSDRPSIRVQGSCRRARGRSEQACGVAAALHERGRRMHHLPRR